MGWVDPWVGLGWVGSGSRIFVFSGLGWVMGLKWQICEKKNRCRVYNGNVEKYMDQKFPFAIRFIILFMYFNFWNAL